MHELTERDRKCITQLVENNSSGFDTRFKLFSKGDQEPSLSEFR